VRPSHDSAGEIQLCSTYSTTGRLGLRGKRQIITQRGLVWSSDVTAKWLSKLIVYGSPVMSNNWQ
jgi:hypothetical protein